LRALKHIFLVFCLCLGHSAPWDAAAQNVQINRVAAVVNGEMITLYDLLRESSQEFFRQGLTGGDGYSEMRRQSVMREVLESMILDILLRQEAERYKVIVEDKEVENDLRMVIQNNQISQEELERRLAAEGSSLADLKDKLRGNILRQRMVNMMIANKVEITPEDIEDYYNEHIKRFSSPNAVKFSMIVFGPGSAPEAVREQIKSEKLTFAEAAKKYSQAPNAALGGQMGEIPWNDLNPAWRQAMQGLAPGGLSPLLRGGDALVLLRVDDLSEGKTQSLEEVAEQIEEEIREPRLRERFTEYRAQLRNRAMVDIRL
jgi:peptidyl-prolyl cis-trans isomerase SurA